MKARLIKKEDEEKINDFFKKDNFDSEEMKKIKKLAMKFNIKLGERRKNFCKKCLSKLEGKIIIGRERKMVTCKNCGFKNRFRVR